MSDAYMGQLARQDDPYDPWERAAARVRFAAKPLAGRQGDPDRIGDIASAPLRAVAGFVQSAYDRAAEEHGGATQLSTDYEPRRMGAVLGTETAMNVVGLPALTGGVPASALGSAARDPNLWHGISKVKLPKPVAEMQATHVPTQQIAEKVITPAQMEGGWLLPALGDRSTAGTNLTGYNGFNFANPIAMQGGHGFMAAQADKGLAWASGDSIVTRLANKTRKLGGSGDPVYFPYTAMGERSVDFSHHVSDTLAEAVRGSNITRKAEREFNRAMKSDDANFGAIKKWPGVASPELRAFLNDAPGDVRNKFAKTMDTAKFQELGFPSVAEARHAVTDPRLLDAPTSAAGLSVAKLDPAGKVIRGASEHNTYSVDLGGQYMGGLGRSVPRDVFYPDMINAYKKAGYQPNQYDYLLARGLKGAPEAQKATPQWVDSVSKWMEQNPRAGMKYSNFTDRKTGAVMGGLAAMDDYKPSGIKAWHASPHDFDKVDLSKIGTGQGAQSYGPGFYAAESPKVSGVGGEYWKEFARHFTGSGPDKDPVMSHAVQILEHVGGDRAAALKLASEAIGKQTTYPQDQIKAVRDLLASDKQVGPRVYELNIKADPRSFLQWDEPLSQQPHLGAVMPQLRGAAHEEAYQRALASTDRRRSNQLWDMVKNPDQATGEFAFRKMSGRGGEDADRAMNTLRDAGIPGIRYADAASRRPVAAKSFYDAQAQAEKRLYEAQQKGAPKWEIEHYQQAAEDAAARIRREMENAPRTFNYVINNPDIIEIMRKLAIPGVVGTGTIGELARQDRREQ